MVTKRMERPGAFVTLVRALLVVAGAPRGIATSDEIGRAVGAHPVVVRRMLGRLRYSGLLETRTGREGGWAIARDPADLTVADIYRLWVEPPGPSSGGGPPADTARDALDCLLDEAHDAYVARLGATTLADLL